MALVDPLELELLSSEEYLIVKPSHVSSSYHESNTERDQEVGVREASSHKIENRSEKTHSDTLLLTNMWNYLSYSVLNNNSMEVVKYSSTQNHHEFLSNRE